MFFGQNSEIYLLLKQTQCSAILIDNNVYYCMERTKGTVVFQSLMTMFNISCIKGTAVPIIEDNV